MARETSKEISIEYQKSQILFQNIVRLIVTQEGVKLL